MHTCYSPVRRSPARKASFPPAAPRLACVKPAASVHPEPGSNSPLLNISCDISFFLLCVCRRYRQKTASGYSFLYRKPGIGVFHLSSFSLVSSLKLAALSCSISVNVLVASRDPQAVLAGRSRFASAKLQPFPLPTKFFSNKFS